MNITSFEIIKVNIALGSCMALLFDGGMKTI